jgi:HEAT repeat protein
MKLTISAVTLLAFQLLWVAPAHADDPPADLEVAVGRLGRTKTKEQTDGAVAAMAQHGDDAVQEIERQSDGRNSHFGWRHTAVRVLKAVNSEKSRALLRRLAIGDLSKGRLNTEQAWAADALVACDRREAWTLLSSSEPFVLTSALSAVEGEPLNQDQMDSLKTCLQHEDKLVSWRAAAVMAGDATGKFAVEAVDAIGQALSAVSDIAGFDEIDLHANRLGTDQTVGEEYYRSYELALAKVKVDDKVLHELASRQKGRARNAVVLALAQRGDKSVRPQILKIAQDPDAEMFRTWAVHALRDLGTMDDIPLLRNLASTDPLEREGLLGPPNRLHTRGTTFPVREAAKAAIRVLEKKFKD